MNKRTLLNNVVSLLGNGNEHAFTMYKYLANSNIFFLLARSNCKILSNFGAISIFQALGTAELVTDMVLGYPGKVDSTPFAVHRCC